jgi:hypothetical protein
MNLTKDLPQALGTGTCPDCLLCIRLVRSQHVGCVQLLPPAAACAQPTVTRLLGATRQTVLI